MLEYNEVVERKYIVLDGAPYEVITSHVFRKQQRKPVNATKLKNLITKKVTEYSFHVSEKVEEAEIDSREIKYLYANKGEYWFCLPTEPSNRFKFTEDEIGRAVTILKPNTVITQLMWTDKTTGFRFPAMVELKVTDAPPNNKGDSATGGNKTVTVETGAQVDTPLFVNTGDVIKINTETFEYKERVNK